MINFMQQVFGVYTPLVNSDGSAIGGFAGADWQYIGACTIFCICLIFAFKVLSGIFRRK